MFALPESVFVHVTSPGVPLHQDSVDGYAKSSNAQLRHIDHEHGGRGDIRHVCASVIDAAFVRYKCIHEESSKVRFVQVVQFVDVGRAAAGLTGSGRRVRDYRLHVHCRHRRSRHRHRVSGGRRISVGVHAVRGISFIVIIGTRRDLRCWKRD